MKKRIGDINKVLNKGRKFGANSHYFHVRVQFPGGAEKHLLLTEHDIKQAELRAAKNPEDLVNPSRLRDLMD